MRQPQNSARTPQGRPRSPEGRREAGERYPSRPPQGQAPPARPLPASSQDRVKDSGVISAVVPANAGTHSPRPLIGVRWSRPFAIGNIGDWVPANAGTTMTLESRLK